MLEDKFNIHLPALVSSNASATIDALTLSQQMPDRENAMDLNAGAMCGASDGLDAQVICADPEPDLHSINATSFERGDLVLLHEGAADAGDHLRDHHHAIVTIAHDSHCTVTVLDNGTQTYGVGECWPSFHSMSMESSMLRLGTQVAVTGMSGALTKHLNGLTGVIDKHPREHEDPTLRHPMFIRKAKCPEKPQLVVCVRFHDPRAAGQSSALLEPRFLEPFDGVFAA